MAIYVGAAGGIRTYKKVTKMAYVGVIDDFGLMDLDIEKCRNIFEVIETRDNRKPTMIISQFPVVKWWDFFTDNTYADACLSRMTSKAYRLECNGRDMRAGK